MTPAVAIARATTAQGIDHLLRQVEAAWVAEEFAAIVAANWPTEPPEPPPAAGPTHPEPPRPRCLARLQPRGRLTDPQVRPMVGARQRAPPPGRSRQPAIPSSHATPTWTGRAGAAKLVRPDGRRLTSEQPGTAELPARSGPPDPQEGGRPARPRLLTRGRVPACRPLGVQV